MRQIFNSEHEVDGVIYRFVGGQLRKYLVGAPLALGTIGTLPGPAPVHVEHGSNVDQQRDVPVLVLSVCTVNRVSQQRVLPVYTRIRLCYGTGNSFAHRPANTAKIT
jgi:hypothetical protein